MFNLEISKTTIVVCVTIFIIVGINATLYVSLVKNKNTVSQFDLLRKATKRARHPWEKEETNLEELSRLVKELNNKKDTEN